MCSVDEKTIVVIEGSSSSRFTLVVKLLHFLTVIQQFPYLLHMTYANEISLQGRLRELPIAKGYL